MTLRRIALRGKTHTQTVSVSLSVSFQYLLELLLSLTFIPL